MKHLLKKALLLVSVLALTGCSSAPEPPVDYTAGDSSLPAVNELVDLGDEFKFDETTGDSNSTSTSDSGSESDATTYVYSGLSSGMQTAQSYAQALEDSWNCRIIADIKTGAEANFATTTGQAAAVCETSDSTQEFVLTIQWTEDSCSVTPSLVQTSQVAAPQPPADSITLEQAVDALKAKTPQQLGLSGDNMDEYLVFAQDGTVMLDDKTCVCVNVYLAQTHQFEQSYLLTLPDLQIYRLDRASGQAVALS